MKGIKAFFRNKWVKFTLVAVIYVLWFVIWSRNAWMLLGLPIIFDLYITKFIPRLLLGKKHKERKANSKAYRETMSWLSAIIFAVVAATLIHTYIFQFYKIPTSSMEKTLMVGDYLCVSKVSFGPRMPMTPLALPLVHNTMPLSRDKSRKSYSEALKRPFKRIAGCRVIEHNDIVVFNFPAGDTVLLRDPEAEYGRVLREFQAAYGPERGRDLLYARYSTSPNPAQNWRDNMKSTIITHPVDKRENYVKRCIALPGDTLLIADAKVYIDSRLVPDATGVQYRYSITTSGEAISGGVFREMGIGNGDMTGFDKLTSSYESIFLTQANVDYLKTLPGVVAVTRHAQQPSSAIFPNESDTSWTVDDFGPLWIPSCGATVALTTANLPLYRRIIEAYEGNTLRVDGDTIYINGVVAQSYTFAMDYFFMMGDNRHNSLDSRYWGFVPQDHIVGTPAFVGWSRDQVTGKVRWDRVFSSQK